MKGKEPSSHTPHMLNTKFLVDNIYIQVGNKIFRQTIGIPMGTDCAPFIADLFLFYHEYKFMKAN